MHSVNTINKYQFHRPTVKLSYFQKTVYYAVMKFSTVYHLISQFEVALQKYLITHFFTLLMNV
jgi:hypothetical protein